VRRGARAVSVVPGAALAASLLTFATGPAASAQVPGVLGVELRAGAAVGAFQTTGAGLEVVPGPALGVSVTWGPSEAIGAYASWASIGFGCEAGFCRGYDVSFASRGPSLGVRGQAPVWGEPWLRAGVLLHEFVQRWGGAVPPGSETTGADPGLEVAAGLTWRAGDRLSLVPGIHLGVLPTRAEDGGTDRAVSTTLELGARWRF
jgi:hypothetical protein